MCRRPIRDRSSDARLVGEKIREARLAKNWTQEELAGESGLDRSFIGSLERGERNPSLETLIQISKALKVKLSTLVADLPD